MRHSMAICAVVVVLTPARVFLETPASAAGLEEGFERIFNGTDLTGWEGKPGEWRVEDGAVACESTKEKPCRKGHYLSWRGGKPSDFDLRAEFKRSLLKHVKQGDGND